MSCGTRRTYTPYDVEQQQQQQQQQQRRRQHATVQSITSSFSLKQLLSVLN
jgi:hypothetical protein